MPFAPALESVRTHTAPSWFHDAKLGIFVHWGLYSVPGWASLNGSPWEVVAKEGSAAWFGRNPYAEWYLNSLKIADSPTRRHHDGFRLLPSRHPNPRKGDYHIEARDVVLQT